MDMITVGELPGLFESVAAVFAEKADELCEMDAKLGDGDLGLTMRKGFGAMPEILREASEDDMGKTLMKSGMKLASAVPSTMGTLMASGFMEAGKALKGSAGLDGKALGEFFSAFAEGIKKRGKCERGDRTVLDALGSAADRAKACADEGGNLEAVAAAAQAGADEGVEATKSMAPKFGKAAVHAAQSAGVADQGAVAGSYMIHGMCRYILGRS